MSALNEALAAEIAPVVERAVERAIEHYLGSRPETYSPAEVADICGVSPATIRKALDAGVIWKLDLPTSYVRIPRAAVDELLARPIADEEPAAPAELRSAS